MKKMKNYLNKGVSPIITIVVIIIIGIIAIGGILAYQYYWQPKEPNTPGTKDETADWKTYKNEEHGFEFKYPSTWSFSDNSPFISNSSYKLIVRYISQEEFLTPVPSFCTVNPESDRCQIADTYNKNQTANIDWTSGDGNTFITIYSSGKGTVELFVTEFADSNKPIILQILSTFRFID